jgi:uncharacterized membrane protein YagU involved in acid resistance
MMNFGALFFYLLCGHAMADFAFQTSFISTSKRRANAPDIWPIVLLAHGLIHGFFVTLFTGSVLLGIFETIAHACIDFGKCENWYGLYTDQFLHILCKVIWILLLAFAMT